MSEVARSSTIGYKKLVPFQSVKASKVRLRINDALACPVISEAGLYRIPEAQLVHLLSRKEK